VIVLKHSKKKGGETVGKIKENISSNITKYRKRMGLSQKDLAEILGTKPSTVSSWEQSVSTPNVEMLSEMCRIFKTTPTQLMGWDYFDKKFDTNKMQKDIKAIEYLEFIGYTIQWDKIATEWEENPDGSKYPVSFDESPDAPCCTLIKEGVVSTFTNQQFDEFLAAIQEAIEILIWKKNKGK